MEYFLAMKIIEKKCVGESQKGYAAWRKLNSGYVQYVCDFILNDAKL